MVSREGYRSEMALSIPCHCYTPELTFKFQQQQQFPQNGFPNHVPTQTPTPGQMQAQTPQSKMNAMLDVQSRLTKQAAQAAQLSKSPQQPPPQLAGSPLVNQNQALANAAQAQAMNMNMNGNANALGRSPAMPSRGQGQLPPHMTPQMANMQLPQQQQQQMGQMQGQGVMQGQGGQMQGQGLPNAMQNLQRQQQQLPQHPHANISRQQNSASPNTTAANLYDNFATLWRKRQDGTLTDHEKSTVSIRQHYQL